MAPLRFSLLTGKKLQPREGKSASAIAEAMRSIISANPIGASEIKDSDLERMQNIDQEAQDYLRSPAEVAQAERDSGPRKRRTPERLADQQPAAFDVEREAEQTGQHSRASAENTSGDTLRRRGVAAGSPGRFRTAGSQEHAEQRSGHQDAFLSSEFSPSPTFACARGFGGMSKKLPLVNSTITHMFQKNWP